MGTSICGGKAEIKCVIGDNEAECTFLFYLRGTNPTVSSAQTEIGNSPFYAKAIAEVESGVQNNRSYLQFNEIGTLGSGWDDFKHCPNRGQDPGGSYGWGMYQLTNPVPNIQQLWDWKANVAEAKTRMTAHFTLATAWIAEQESQQQAADPSKPLQNFTFSWNGVNFKKGTQRTPIDACAIWKYNGHGGLWPIYWDNPSKTWKQRASFYLDKVCGKL